MYKTDYAYPEEVHTLYKSTYEQINCEPPDSFRQPSPDEGRMLFDIDLFTAADKFVISMLKDAGAARFDARCKQHWATREFAAAIVKVYQVPAGFHTALKTAIMETVADHSAELLQKRFHYPGFHAAMRSNADFSTAVAVKVSYKEPEQVFVEKVGSSSVPAMVRPSASERLRVHAQSLAARGTGSRVGVRRGGRSTLRSDGMMSRERRDQDEHESKYRAAENMPLAAL